MTQADNYSYIYSPIITDTHTAADMCMKSHHKKQSQRHGQKVTNTLGPLHSDTATVTYTGTKSKFKDNPKFRVNGRQPSSERLCYILRLNQIVQKSNGMAG